MADATQSLSSSGDGSGDGGGGGGGGVGEGGREGDGEAGSKWPCGSCTYLNWPTALRCTLCRSHKPCPRIEDLRAHQPRQDPSDLPDPLPPTNPDADLMQKWECAGCTYLNWPRSRRCVQCRAVRDGTSSASPPLHGSQELGGAGQGGTGPVSGASSPRQGTSTSLEPRLLAKKLAKWTCPTCTYENWQKAHTCVMCYSQRPGTTSGTAALSRRGRLAPAAGDSADALAAKRRGDEGDGASGRKSPKSASSSSSSENLSQSGAPKPSRFERALRRLRQDRRHQDVLWLTAVRSVAGSALDSDPAEAFLAAGGEAARALTPSEAALLNGELGPADRLEPGHTLIHLAVKHNREDLIALLLASTDPSTAPLKGPSGGMGQSRPSTSSAKRVPCHVAPELAAEVRRCVSLSLRQRKGDFACFYFTELSTFSLPHGVTELSGGAQTRLWRELLDGAVRAELEDEAAVLNWAPELTERLGSRLFPLWNRMAGDCLLDSVLQATWGVFDSENSLRQALYDSLQDAGGSFYPRWREYEIRVASRLGYTLTEAQLAADWALILTLASKPGSALEQAHILALAHIARRPIIVYGVGVVKSWRGEQLDYARFQGIYLPLLWEPGFCAASPIALGYVGGHFSALVPLAGAPSLPTSARDPALRHSDDRHRPQRPALNDRPDRPVQSVYLPVVDSEGVLLPIHFLRRSEVGSEKELLRSWLDLVRTDSGLLAAKTRLHRQPLAVAGMVEEWLDFYARLPDSPPPSASSHPHAFPHAPLIEDSLPNSRSRRSPAISPPPRLGLTQPLRSSQTQLHSARPSPTPPPQPKAPTPKDEAAKAEEDAAKLPSPQPSAAASPAPPDERP